MWVPKVGLMGCLPGYSWAVLPVSSILVPQLRSENLAWVAVQALVVDKILPMGSLVSSVTHWVLLAADIPELSR